LKIFPICIDQVEVWIPFEVRGKSDFFTIWSPGWRKVDGLVLGDLFDVGPVEISDEDLLTGPLENGIGNFCIVNPFLPRDLKNNFIGNSVDCGSKGL
jgi:hypothetical protein